VLMGNSPRVLLKNVAPNDERIEPVLKTTAPLPETLNLENCLEGLVTLAKNVKAPAKECHLITDAQAVSFENVPEAARKALSNLRGVSSVFLLPVGTEQAENLSIARLAAASGVLRKNALVRYVADVHNTGRQVSSNVTVQLLVNDNPVDQRLIEKIGPGETVPAPLFARFDQPGVFSVSARLGKDALAADNERYAIANIRETINVLCVDGSPSRDPFRGETGFLNAALLAEAGQNGAKNSATMNVTTVRPDEFHTEALSTQDLVVLADVPEVTREQAAALATFVRNGGGLIVFVGRKTDAGLTNSRMRDGDGKLLLPADLLNPVGEIQAAGAGKPDVEGWGLAAEIADHPITGILRTIPAEQWRGARFRRYFKVTPLAGSSTLLRLAQSGDPILLERSLGRGKVLLFTSTANREWTDLVVYPAYLMLVQQAVTHLTRKSYEAPVTVSQELAFDVPPGADLSALRLRDPKSEDRPVEIKDRDGRKTAVLGEADKPGIYTFRPSANGPELKMAVNVNTAESDVAVLRSDALDEAANQLSLRVISEGQDIKAATRESRIGREMWRTLVLLALAALVAESLLAKRFARLMTGAPQPLARKAEVI